MVLAACAAVLAAGPAQAELRLPRIFTDNMILQQELPVAIWGWADTGAKITVAFNGKTAAAIADSAGKWRVNLPAMKADGKAHTLTVTGDGDLTLKNVVLGEIWLCAGQSNMNREAPIKKADPSIRLYWVDYTRDAPATDDLTANVVGWLPATPEGVANTSWRFKSWTGPRGCPEVGYVFGRKIHKTLKVPVGLIKAAVGGSSVQSWTAPDGNLYQLMVRGLAPLTIRGVVWYQGESNGRDKEYHISMKLWIASWRKVWGRPKMPIYFAQISPMTYGGKRMQHIWEAQSWVAANIPHAYLGASNDIFLHTPYPILPGQGNYKRFAVADHKLSANTGDPHPPNKHIVGERLANIALVETYGRPKTAEVYAPVYDSHKVVGAKVLVKFKHVGKGLRTRDDKPLAWFELSPSDADGYVKAIAKLVSPDTVEVSAAAVKSPKYVRFAWDCLAIHNLMNDAGLPAISFRTDAELRDQK